MTKKEFLHLLKQGRGKCIQELKSAENKDKYKDIVLWACTHDFTFDYQCEGTRAHYAYELVKCYDNREIFLDAVVDKFRKMTLNSDFIVAHLTELLQNFAADGNEKAKSELENKYNQFYNEILRSRTCKDCFAFEIISIALVKAGVINYDEIKKDIDNIISQNKHYDSTDFINFTSEMQDDSDEKETAVKPDIKTISLDEFMSGKGSAFFVGKMIYQYGDGADLKIAEGVLNESDKNLKDHMLKVFRYCKWPFDAQILIDYSKDDELTDTAFDVLEKTCDDKVKNYALELIDRNEKINSAVSMLITNFDKCYRELLVELVKKIPINDNSYEWHGVQMDLIYAFERKTDGLPEELLYYIYETTLCGCCRRNTLKIMRERELLTEKIAEECGFDSFEDIREMIKNH